MPDTPSPEQQKFNREKSHLLSSYSAEAVSASKGISLRSQWGEEMTEVDIARFIDVAFATHRQQVQRLVEAAKRARDIIDAYESDLDSQQFSRAKERLIAALEPFTTQHAGSRQGD